MQVTTTKKRNVGVWITLSIFFFMMGPYGSIVEYATGNRAAILGIGVQVGFLVVLVVLVRYITKDYDKKRPSQLVARLLIVSAIVYGMVFAASKI